MTEPKKAIPGRNREKEVVAKIAEAEKPKRLYLSVLDRLLMSSLFPEKGNYMTNLLVEDIGVRVRISQDEGKKINLRTSPPDSKGSVQTLWDGKKTNDKSFEFSSAEIAFLKSRVEFLDRTEAITRDIMPLVKKIKEA
jgi:hypothetical protein